MDEETKTALRSAAAALKAIEEFFEKGGLMVAVMKEDESGKLIAVTHGDESGRVLDPQPIVTVRAALHEASENIHKSIMTAGGDPE